MNDDELDLVRSIAADTAEPGAATIQAARARLLAVIATEVAADHPRPTRRRAARLARKARLRRLLAGSAVVAAVLTAALVAPLLLQRPASAPRAPGMDAQPPGSMPSAEPTVDQVLTAAALAAARAPAPGFGPGRYWYVRERGVKLGTNLDQAGSTRSFFYRFGYRSETWWALDGSLSGQLHNSRAEFLDEGERAAWVAAGRPDLGLPNTEVYSPKEKQRVVGIGWLPASYQDLVELPTDPARLLAALTQRTGTHPDGLLTGSKRPPGRTQVLFDTIGYLLEHYPLPPQLRAGLYQVLTRLDGVKLVGNVTDLAGRHGIAVALDVDRLLHERNELLLEPATGRLLGARSVLTRTVPGWRVPAGTVVDQRVFLQASVVDSRTTRPRFRAVPRGGARTAADRIAGLLTRPSAGPEPPRSR
jgi:hypothetical protein